jgi:hypothetical protein
MATDQEITKWRHRKMVERYLECGSMTQVAQEFGVSKGGGYKMIMRFLDETVGPNWSYIRDRRGLDGLREALEEKKFWG